MLEGMKEICGQMGNSIKEFVRQETEGFKKDIGDLKKELAVTDQKVQMVEAKILETDKEVDQLRQQNKQLQRSFLTLECKSMQNYFRLRGIPEEEDENVFELVVDLLSFLLK